ncbi:MAG: hypothetical protein A3B31_02520 [Candidatus Komeilibacteria bacterium RIFCSPLOWO2_01_FULL_53_11]|uniref:CMP/dCMP-type deaminase domain-containing protein n=1 Tax=Candidatus Komeilibacteria bacterium RIFCSPLOWO2_01_FULL_53_11 TaxID=1798552 RepID=A0A1G2BTJ7_9BACT|nr:MAG: hypothetical protein A3B31_02520 [Candidatus Komeilibacteria bacterium RIFCSPLOWO2_01_FULL_53_11]
MDDDRFLHLAIEKSRESVSLGGFPVGVIVARNGKVIGSGTSDGEKSHDPAGHAEMRAIRETCKKLKSNQLKDAVLYSSLEPCMMCYSASIWAAISRIVYACGRDRVSADYYEGKHNFVSLNKSARKPLELLHISELEEKALKIITEWENKNT